MKRIKQDTLKDMTDKAIVLMIEERTAQGKQPNKQAVLELLHRFTEQKKQKTNLARKLTMELKKNAGN